MIDEIHSIAMKRYQESSSVEQDERENCVEDIMFAQVPGSMYNDHGRAKADRPRYEINKIAQAVNQLIGEQRQNRVAIKVRPSGGVATKEVADTFSALIRNIEVNSRFNDVKDNAFKDVVNGGFGCWTINTEFSNETSFDQDIRIKAVRSAATSVFYDPTAVEENKQDSDWFIITEDISREAFNKRYPKATANSLSDTTKQAYYDKWYTQDTVKIADYWVRTQVRSEIVLLTNGKTVALDDKAKSVLDDLARQGITIVKDNQGNERKRVVMRNKVEMYKISGSEILAGPFEWAGSMIPVVVFFGFNYWISGKHYYRGIVRMAKDPQRVYNYATSTSIETAALTPKDPHWITAKQAEGYKRQFENFNVSNSPFMFYNSDPSAPGPPQRTGAPVIQTALIQQVQQAQLDIESTTGRAAPALGQQINDESGRAILAQQKQSDIASFELNDNLSKAVAYTGKILVDLIPRIVDTERQVMLVGEDGQSSLETVNQEVVDEETGESVILNDLSQGEFAVMSDSGPSYATKRIETLNLLSSMAATNPTMQEVSTDLLAKNLDFPFAEELETRVRKSMVAKGLIEPNDEELKKMQDQAGPSPVEQVQFEQMKMQLELQAATVDAQRLMNEKTEAEIIKVKAETDKVRADVAVKQVTVIKDKAEISQTTDFVPIDPDELEARKNNQALINDSFEKQMTDNDDIIR